MPANATFFASCIYTMPHSAEPGYIHAGGGSGIFVERKSWRTGLDLFRQAQAAGLFVPVIFSAAEEDSGLIYFGRLTAVEIDEERGATSYSFADLRRIEPARPKSALRLVSTGSNLSDDYIRPYAVCETPADLVSWPLGGVLPPIPKKRLTGEEHFRQGGRDLDLSLIEFWRWSMSFAFSSTRSRKPSTHCAWINGIFTSCPPPSWTKGCRRKRASPCSSSWIWRPSPAATAGSARL